MGGTLDYSTTAASNTTVGGVSIAEGMQAGLVNNGMRAMMADSRKWQLDWSGVTTAGSSNAYTMTCNQGITAYADGQRFSFRADRNNTGAATLNIDSRGAKALRKVQGGTLAALVADDIVEKGIYDVVFNSADDVFVILGAGHGSQPADATLTSLSGLSLSAGDTLYATAADTLARLAKGTARQAYVMNAGATAPEWADPNYTWSSVTTNGASVYDFGSIPSWATEIVCLFTQVSLTTKTDTNTIQIGTGGTPATSGYDGNTATLVNAGAVVVSYQTGSFVIATSEDAVTGTVRLMRRSGSNEWVAEGGVRRAASGQPAFNIIASRISLAGSLDIVRLIRSGVSNYNGGTFAVGYR